MIGLLNIDWLQLNCIPANKGFFQLSKQFTSKKMNYQTRHFKIVEEVFDKGRRIATIARQPHSKIIPAPTLLIKFDNWLLYQKDLHLYIKNFIDKNNLVLSNISRIDLCIDFERFSNNDHPAEFIKKFINCVYLKNGKAKFKIAGEHEFYNSFDYLRFGTNTSDVCSYIYNKSKELQQVKEKAYIRDAWIDAGLKTDDTWRLEFSLKSSAKELINKSTGECLDVNNLEIINSVNLNLLFNSLLRKYFRFHINDNTMNKSRMAEVELFIGCETEFTMQDKTSKFESNRSDKIFAKKLNELNNELRGTDFNLSIYSTEMLHGFVHTRGLTNWAVEKNILH